MKVWQSHSFSTGILFIVNKVQYVYLQLYYRKSWEFKLKLLIRVLMPLHFHHSTTTFTILSPLSPFHHYLHHFATTFIFHYHFLHFTTFTISPPPSYSTTTFITLQLQWMTPQILYLYLRKLNYPYHLITLLIYKLNKVMNLLPVSVEIMKGFYIREKHFLIGSKLLILLRDGQSLKGLILYTTVFNEILMELFVSVL